MEDDSQGGAPGRQKGISRLDGWKEIGAHLGRSVRTVQRWEGQYGLPVKRLSRDRKSPVFVEVAELNQWWRDRQADIAEIREANAGQCETVAPLPVLVAAPDHSSARRYIWAGGVLAAISLASALSLWSVQETKGTDSATAELNRLTFLEGSEESPSPSADGSQIAMTYHPPGGYRDLYVLQRKTGQHRRLTQTEAEEHSPVWSPRGSTIAFVRAGAGVLNAAEIILLDTVTGRESRLAMLTSFSWGSGLSWTQDGEYVLGVDREGEGPFRICSFDARTGQRRWITSPPAGSYGDFSPAGIPGSRDFLFQRYAGTSERQTDVWLQKWSGGAPVRMTQEQAAIAGFGASSDGRWLSLAIKRDRRLWALWKIGPSFQQTGVRSSWQRVETPEKPGSPVWNGTDEILFSAGQPSYQHMYLVDLVNRKMSDRPVCATSRDTIHPDWSRDGRVAFLTWGHGGWDLQVCHPADGHLERLTRFEDPTLSFPRWSPDTRHIAFLRRRGRTWNLWVLTADRPSDARSIADLRTGNATAPAWSADGRHLFAILKGGKGQAVWRIPLKQGEPMEQFSPVPASEVSVDSRSGEVYVATLGGKNLLRARKDGTTELVATGVPPGQQAVANGHLYAMRPGFHGSQHAELVRYRLGQAGGLPSGGEVIVHARPGMYNTETGALIVNRDSTRAVWVLINPQERDIYSVRFPR